MEIFYEGKFREVTEEDFRICGLTFKQECEVTLRGSRAYSSPYSAIADVTFVGVWDTDEDGDEVDRLRFVIQSFTNVREKE